MVVVKLEIRKAQSSIEFLSVFGLAMLLAAPFIVSAQNSVVQLRMGADAAELQNSMDKLETAISTVDASGPPAKRTFQMDMPSLVEESYLVNNKAIVYTVDTPSGNSNISRIFDARVVEVSDSLPENQGVYPVSVTAWKDQVNISRRGTQSSGDGGSGSDEGSATEPDPYATGVFYVEQGEMSFLNTENGSTFDVYSSETVEVLGLPDDDLDSDSLVEALFVTSDGGLKAVDSDGQITSIASNAKSFKSRVGIDKSESPTKVYYPGGSNDGYEIYSSSASTTSSEFADPGSGVLAVAGAGDVDGDSEREVVFVGGSQTVRYVEPDGSIVSTGVTIGSNNGIGIGAPKDFDEDGTVRIPIVDGNNNIALVEGSGSKQVLTSNSLARKTSISSMNIDEDSNTEIVFVSNDGGKVKHIDPKTSDVSTVTPEIKPETSVGISAVSQ